jgi:MSHA biogenesis protein MshK
VPKPLTLLALAALMLISPHTAFGNELRDPTRPYSATPRNVNVAVPYRVSAVFVARDRRVAIVNGKRVVEGDRVAGATVAAIHDNRVQLTVGGKKIVVHLLPPASRK